MSNGALITSKSRPLTQHPPAPTPTSSGFSQLSLHNTLPTHRILSPIILRRLVHISFLELGLITKDGKKAASDSSFCGHLSACSRIALRIQADIFLKWHSVRILQFIILRRKSFILLKKKKETEQITKAAMNHKT